jgi:hypothetical protein
MQVHTALSQARSFIPSTWVYDHVYFVKLVITLRNPVLSVSTNDFVELVEIISVKF